ncbi:MAG TPA: hypothetical protein VL588_06310, partial [Bdellovibrionota bacterium]|nr:hypothetical protein [Bdellovibrionota bacterium]
ALNNSLTSGIPPDQVLSRMERFWTAATAVDQGASVSVGAAGTIFSSAGGSLDLVRVGHRIQLFCTAQVGFASDISIQATVGGSRLIGCPTTGSYTGSFLNVTCGGGEIAVGGANLAIGVDSPTAMRQYLHTLSTDGRMERIQQQWEAMDDTHRRAFAHAIVSARPPRSQLAPLVIAAIINALPGHPLGSLARAIQTELAQEVAQGGFRELVNRINPQESLDGSLSLIADASRSGGMPDLASALQDLRPHLTDCDSLAVAAGVGAGVVPLSCGANASYSAAVGPELNMDEWAGSHASRSQANPFEYLRRFRHAVETGSCTREMREIRTHDLEIMVHLALEFGNWAGQIASDQAIRQCAVAGQRTAEFMVAPQPH